MTEIFDIFLWFLKSTSQNITVLSKEPGFPFILGETLSTLIYPFTYMGVYIPNIFSLDKLLSIVPSYLGYLIKSESEITEVI